MIVLKKTIGVRVPDATEATGLDLAEHGETAYHSAVLG
jgi:ammonia channel protein AmtB